MLPGLGLNIQYAKAFRQIRGKNQYDHCALGGKKNTGNNRKCCYFLQGSLQFIFKEGENVHLTCLLFVASFFVEPSVCGYMCAGMNG